MILDKTECLYCKIKFEPNIKKGIWKRQKYCSAKCRNKYWKKTNPKRFEYHRRRGYIKHKKSYIIICKLCKKEIPFNKRKSGKTLCSKECKHKQFLLIQKKHRDNIAFKFKEFKESLGCYRCKYNKYGGFFGFFYFYSNKKFRLNIRYQDDYLRWFEAVSYHFFGFQRV